MKDKKELQLNQYYFDNRGNLERILGRFENGTELYNNNPLFHKCIELLLREADINKLLEQVVVMCSNQSKLLWKAYNLIPDGTTHEDLIALKNNLFIAEDFLTK